MARVTRRRPIRAIAPLDDAAIGSDPLVVDPAATDDRLDHHRGPHATLVQQRGGPADRPRTTRVVLLEPDGTLGTGARGTRRREVLVDGWHVIVDLEPAARAALRERARRGGVETSHGGPVEVRAIIPGRVLSIAVAAGDPVVAGQQLLVVEAMKMQNELRAPRDGVIERLAVAPGGTIELGDLLVVLS